MFAITLLTSLTLIPFVNAQATSLGVEAIEAHFSQSAIVPDLLASFNPSALLTLNFPVVGDVQPGQSLTQAQVAQTPTVTITPANSSTSLNSTYTLVMVDADIVGSKLPQGQTRHWLENSVVINGSVVSNASATVITRYAGPAPAAGSGPHRYVVLLYAQPSTFKAPPAYSQSNIGVSTFDFNAYVQESGLGALIAGNYFTVEVETATVSISATSPVVSSTLPVLSTSPSSSSSSSSSSTPSKTSGASDLVVQSSFLAVSLILAKVLLQAVCFGC
ncbi:phosphatidylethanolamine-binding protein [Gymnopilus junonius]|uniref:Phosphatidylethanolamine-binding protein n=1 Tax=Gymnopilus junonius TaxID=109634 RepID=A0A9P5ND45_GYMJU|nr:phosphatidylethanolamine-binding protein [Gymnopilus junonius]